jgi:micrococcal nuclease
VIRTGAIVLLAATACNGDDGGTSSVCGPTSAIAQRVIDGDTIELDTGERVRYLLVDTPESVNGATDCYGQNAKTLNSDLVNGKPITLVYDESACTDRFGRLLAYVSVGGQEVNRILVERGYACVLYIPPAGTSRHTEFEDLELRARTLGSGMWSACAVVTCD